MEDQSKVAELMQFVETVKAMRTAQQSFFKDRSPQWLSESKRLEKIVDKQAASFLEPTEEIQLELFSGN
jgi:hypothetical protein